MKNVPIDIVDESYTSRSLPLSAQVSRNLYPEIVKTGKTSSALHSFPGKKLFSTGSGANRGLHTWSGSVYAVNGTSLYKIDSSGTQTSLGSISGTARCVFAGSASYLYIVSNGLVWRTDGTTVSSVTDSDLESPNSVAFLNSTLIYDGNDGRFVTSDPGDGSAVDSLNYATAEALPDDLVRVYVFNQQLYLMGESSIEPWYNSGVGSPPFDRIEGGISQIGISGTYAVTNTDKALYFLGSDKTAYRLEGYAPVQISTIAINHAIENYSDTSDCFAYSLKLEGMSFVVFQFPTANKTWAYVEESNAWIELSSGVTGGRDVANGYTYAYNKHLVSDYQNGNLYELDLNTYDDNGSTYIRERVLKPFSSIDLGAPGKRVTISKVELIIETGVGLATGQGVAPVFMMSISTDGKTWSEEKQVSPGVLGDYTKKVEYYKQISGYEFMVKIRISDPINVSIHSASIDFRLAGY